jgi:predicted DNA-binding protein (MmcQ/YjbR family)
MITAPQIKKMVLSLEYTEELPHHHITSYRVKGKIFATVNAPENRATVRLSSVDQSVFCSYNAEIIYPVPNAWGKHGWTRVNLKKVRKDLFNDLLKTAYETGLKSKVKKSSKK